jgi:hypothetical protein
MDPSSCSFEQLINEKQHEYRQILADEISHHPTFKNIDLHYMHHILPSIKKLRQITDQLEITLIQLSDRRHFNFMMPLIILPELTNCIYCPDIKLKLFHSAKNGKFTYSFIYTLQGTYIGLIFKYFCSQCFTRYRHGEHVLHPPPNKTKTKTNNQTNNQTNIYQQNQHQQQTNSNSNSNSNSTCTYTSDFVSRPDPIAISNDLSTFTCPILNSTSESTSNHDHDRSSTSNSSSYIPEKKLHLKRIRHCPSDSIQYFCSSIFSCFSIELLRELDAMILTVACGFSTYAKLYNLKYEQINEQRFKLFSEQQFDIFKRDGHIFSYELNRERILNAWFTWHITKVKTIICIQHKCVFMNMSILLCLFVCFVCFV